MGRIYGNLCFTNFHAKLKTILLKMYKFWMGPATDGKLVRKIVKYLPCGKEWVQFFVTINSLYLSFQIVAVESGSS